MSAVAPVPNKHQQRSEATRRKLIAAARRIFARVGFEAARIEDIAADAGHTRGAFYANFHNKESLFLALLEQQISEHIGHITEQLQCCESDREKLAALRAYYLERVNDRLWCMLMLEFKSFAVRHPRLRAKLARAHRQIRSSLKSQIDGLLPRISKDGSEEATRSALEATLHGLVLQHTYDPETLSREQMTEILGHLFDTLTAAHASE
jgi:AcrR family transcriptional regulator